MCQFRGLCCVCVSSEGCVVSVQRAVLCVSVQKGVFGYSGGCGVVVLGYSGGCGVGVFGYSGGSGVGVFGYSGGCGVGVFGYSGGCVCRGLGGWVAVQETLICVCIWLCGCSGYCDVAVWLFRVP